jgi:hypothetical protein
MSPKHPPHLSPESLLAYEIGNKFSLPRYRLRLNLSAFYYDYRNQQVQSAVVNPLTGPVGSIINAPLASLWRRGADSLGTDPAFACRGILALAEGAFDRFSTVSSAVQVNGIMLA